MMAGMVSVALTHPGLMDVTPHLCMDIDEMIDNFLTYPESTFGQESEEARAFAMSHNSFAAVSNQWERALGRLL